MDESLLEFRRAVSRMNKLSRIKECFYHNHDECRGTIKQSHSIQRNGRLTLIEGEVNGQQVVYTFTSHKTTRTRFVADLVPVGKGEASTFFGFCDYHDSVLFAPVENNAFDGSSKHLFLHSYRSFAHSFHRKKEEYKLHSEGNDPASSYPEPLATAVLQHVRVALNEGRSKKEQLDRMIDEGNHDGLEYVYAILDRSYPVACSSIITPDFHYGGGDFNNHLDPARPFQPIMLTVLPDEVGTIVILACFPEDKDAMRFLDEIDELSDYSFNVAISSLMITYVENTFFSPKLWRALGDRGRKTLLRELNDNFTKEVTRFRKCQTNFFMKHLS